MVVTLGAGVIRPSSVLRQGIPHRPNRDRGYRQPTMRASPS
jgi:hypothetical protein